MIGSLKELYAGSRRDVNRSQGPYVAMGWSESIKMALLIAAMSFLYSVARFSGLEYHSGYFGNAFQALHPESFPGDKYMPPFRPTMLSIYYLLVRMVGEMWLDDRFTIVVYFGLVVLALIALDKTARLLGAVRLEERIAILSLMLVGHTFKDNLAQLVSRAEFNPTTLAGPVALWLLYTILAGKKPTTVIPLMVLLGLISMKSAWLPVAIGLVVLFKERLGFHAKIVVGSGAMVLGAIAFLMYYLILRPPDQTHVALFDYIVQYMDNSEANPFMDTWISNILFLLLCVGGFLVRLPSESVVARVKMVAFVGAFVWLVGGLYLSYAPDEIKIPYLVPLDVNRALWWPQYVLFVAIGVSVLKWVQDTQSWRGLSLSYAILLALYLTPFNYKHAGMVGILLFLMWMWLIYIRTGSSDESDTQPKGIRRWRIETVSQDMRLRIIAVVLCATTLSSFASATIHRLPALHHLIQHGVMGDNPGAKWIGVNEYFRNETPASSTVLALTMHDYPWRRPVGLRFEGSLRTRSGRSMPLGHEAGFHFDYQSILWNKEHAQHMAELVERWERQDLPGVSASLLALGSPDYLVVPTVKAGWLRDVPEFNYVVETVIGESTIMRRVPSE